MTTLTLQPLDDLVAQLVELDAVRSASTDPSELGVLPAVWVEFAGIELDLLGAYSINARLTLLVDDTDHKRSRLALLQLLSAVLELVDADDTIVTQPTVLPDSPKVLPGLMFPVTLTADYTQE